MTAPERIWATGQNSQPAGRWWHNTEIKAGVEYVRADLASVPAQVRVKPLDLSNALKHAFISGRVSAGADSSFHADAWVEYDPTESVGYARILAALEPQPDPRDEVIARLVEALEITRETAHSMAHSEFDGVWNQSDFDNYTPEADAALAAAKAVLK